MPGSVQPGRIHSCSWSPVTRSIELEHCQPLVEPADLTLDPRIHNVSVQRFDQQHDDGAQQQQGRGIGNSGQARHVIDRRGPHPEDGRKPESEAVEEDWSAARGYLRVERGQAIWQVDPREMDQTLFLERLRRFVMSFCAPVPPVADTDSNVT